MRTKFPGLDLDLRFRPSRCDRPVRLTRAQIEAYNRDGYVAGVRLLEGARLAAAQRFFLDEYPALAAPLNDFGLNHHARFAPIHDLVTDPAVAAPVRDLLGPAPAPGGMVCFISQYVLKAPGDRRRTPWHQDSSYNGMDAGGVIAWLALTDATIDNGCLWCVPGSHLADGHYEFEPSPASAESLGGHEVAGAERLGRPTPIELAAGEAVLFSDKLLHSAGGNTTADYPRAGFTMSFARGDVRPKHTANLAVVACGSESAAGPPAPGSLGAMVTRVPA